MLVWFSNKRSTPLTKVFEKTLPPISKTFGKSMIPNKLIFLKQLFEIVCIDFGKLAASIFKLVQPLNA